MKMKSLVRLLLLLGATLALVTPVQAARQGVVLQGRVVDDKASPVAYATVVLLEGEEQVAGLATDDEGRFKLTASAGSYTLRVQYVGYETVEQEVTLPSGPIADIVLHTQATEIESVEVMAPLIRREADRFVVDVTNSTVAIGKDGAEILETAPGVWVADDQISINGQSGSKVYLNERELKMEGEQLLRYLRTLRAEDISKIEVIPLSGADYDANSSGGIIKITLKRRRDDGLQGALSYDLTGGKYGLVHSPNFNLDYNKGRVNLYASGWFNDRRDLAINDEQTNYLNNNSSLQSHAEVEGHARGGGGRVGSVIELSKRHSVGAEVEYWAQGEESENCSSTDLMQPGVTSHQQSLYLKEEQLHHFTVALNYIYKLDTLGSNLKLLADYTRRGVNDHNDNSARITQPGITRDSLFRDHSDNRYDIFTASLGWEQRLSPTWQLKAGAKYTRNDNQNMAEYRYLLDEAWTPSTMSDFDIRYQENIGALYAIVAGRVGRVSLSAGLRGEYTYTVGRATDLKQEYFSLFPNAHLAWSMDKEGKHSLVASYARTISRPGFWSLSPTRMQLSDYSYSIGNPGLDPSFTNSYTLNLVMWYQYSLSIGIYNNTDSIQQIVRQDSENPDQLYMTWVNYPDYNIYYASLSLPIQLTKWWRWNSNLSYMLSGQRLAPEEPLEYHSLAQWYTAMTFQLPKKFMIEASYFGRTKAVQGNMQIDGIHLLNFSLKKRLLKERLTLTLSAESVLDMPTRLTATQPEFTRSFHVHQFWQGRTYKFGISYNFQTGKQFQQRKVESGSADEKGRL